MSGEQESHLIGEENKPVAQPEILIHSEESKKEISELTEDLGNLNVSEEKKEDNQDKKELEEDGKLEGKSEIGEGKKESERVELSINEPGHLESKIESVGVKDLESRYTDPVDCHENPIDHQSGSVLDYSDLTGNYSDTVDHHASPVEPHSDYQVYSTEPHSTPLTDSDLHSTHNLDPDLHSTKRSDSDPDSTSLPHHKDPQTIHSNSLPQAEPQQAISKPPESSTKLLYSHLVDHTTSKQSEFTSPFIRKFKREGRFHETLLLNYLNNGGDFLSEKVLEINGEIMTIEDFNWTSRSLQVSEDEIMFTGGTGSYTKVYILSIETKEIRELPHLNQGRDLHAMTWIDGKPAVIGGGDISQDPLSSVEVFDKHWKTIHGLHHARYGHSATYHFDRTWVVAGANGKNSPVNAIEYYEKGHWHSLSLSHEFNRVGAGLVAAKSSIYILGGFASGKNNTASVLVFNIDDETVSEGKELQEPASFSQNLWRLTGKYIESLGFRGKKISYRPE